LEIHEVTHHSKTRRSPQQSCNDPRRSVTTNAEYFADHPDAAWRMTVRWFNPNFFVFKIVTREGGLISTGDRWDISARMDRCGGSPLERLRRTVRRLLADPNRTRRVRAA
jgi:hypothetical protein